MVSKPWLGLDLGNSRLKAALFLPGSPHKALGSIQTTRPFPKAMAEGVEGILLSSVRSEGATAAVVGGLPAGLGVVSVGDLLPASDVGAQAYGNPPLGEDRRLHFLGLRALWPEGGVGAISAGTVLAVSAWGADDRFVGGYLFPGRTSLMDALGRVARLPDLSPDGLRSGPGGSAEDAVRAGVDEGWSAALETLARGCQGLLPEGCRWAVTGGDLPVLSEGLPSEWAQEPDLLWLGMSRLLERM